ncbi:hypothetical protein F5I97DRAFT_1931115 [Phlebopus sp. FC_14]|nr:hypothetical protein F5I97DRAFT_1931115 [Phlebopus sp. FC_14]
MVAILDLHNTFGASFIGGMVTMVLYGLTTLQTYLYYMYYPNDDLDTKALVRTAVCTCRSDDLLNDLPKVAVIWILDTLHISLMCHSLYYYLVSNFGDPTALVDGTCPKLSGDKWPFIPDFSRFESVHSCPSPNILFHPDILPYRWWVVSPIMFLVLAHFAFGVETVVLMFMKKQFAALSQIALYAATPFAIAAVLSDLCIAGALCVLLYGNRSPFERTNRLVNTLIVYAINRCLLTSVVAIVEVIVFAVSPHSLWFLAIDFVIGKLYANSFLASLNTRSALRDRSLHSRDPTVSSMRINTIHLTDLQTTATSEADEAAHVNGNMRKPKHVREMSA